MDLTTDGTLLLAANNADDPSFVTLFSANGDQTLSNVFVIKKTTIDHAILPPGFGLGIEQPAWDPKTKRFYTSIPIIADNPPGCNYGQPNPPNPIPCSGGLLVTDPLAPNGVEGAYDPVKNTGVNLPGSTTTLVINATTHNYAQVAGITGSDEVWFNKGDKRYYTGSSNAIKPAGSTLGRGSVLGVIDGTSVLIETMPQSSGSHSVAADSERNLIFVPQVYTSAPTAIPLGDQNFTPGGLTVGQLICGTTNGCIAVYTSPRAKEKEKEEADGSDARQ